MNGIDTHGDHVDYVPRQQWFQPGTFGDELLIISTALNAPDPDRQAATSRARALGLPHYRNRWLCERGLA